MNRSICSCCGPRCCVAHWALQAKVMVILLFNIPVKAVTLRELLGFCRGKKYFVDKVYQGNPH